MNESLENWGNIKSVNEEFIYSLITNESTLNQEFDTKSIIKKLDKKVDFLDSKFLKLSQLKSSIKKETKPLIIGVVGGFSTGKSSFINSLLGEESLGVKVEPATAKITQLVYGEKTTYKRILKNGDVQKISSKEYKKYSIHDHSIKTKNNTFDEIDHFQISIDNKYLQKVNIIDTPGFSSISKKDDSLTKKWMDKLDALVWLFDAEKVGDKMEIDLLKQYSGKHIIGIINKIDLKQPSVREKIMKELSDSYDFANLSFYSSKKVVSNNENNIEANDLLNMLGDLMVTNFNKNNAFNIEFLDKEVHITLDGKKESFKRFKKNKNDDFSKYKLNVEYILSGLKDKVFYIQMNKFYYDKELLENDVANFEQQLVSEIEKIILFSSKKSELFNDIHEKILESLRGRSNDLWQSFRDDLFDEIYNKLDFEFSAERLKQEIKSRFYNYKNDVLVSYNKIASKIDYLNIENNSTFNKNNYSNIDTYIDALIFQTVDSIEALTLLKDCVGMDEEKTKYIIDLLVPDESLYDFINQHISDDIKNLTVDLEYKFKNLAEQMQKYLAE